MFKANDLGLRMMVSLALIAALLYLPVPAYSQQNSNIQNLIANGNFQEGFQDFGVGYGWGAFSNGQALVGWNVDTWEKVVPSGQTSAQMIEIKNAQERDRYAGIYQTVPVVAGQQYKLTIKGLIRSTEGDVQISDYGYRLQYGLDYNGGTAWELVAGENWHELPWNEQPLYDPAGGAYRFDTFEATVTAKSDQLTLYLRGWKKWINNGSGIYNIQEVSLVGPAPAGFESSMGQVASVSEAAPPAAEQFIASAAPGQVSENPASGQPDSQTLPPDNPPAVEAPANEPPQTTAPLPVSGQGQDDSINYVVISSIVLLLVLFVGAITATIRRRKLTD
ncbi:MAG: hypothetical protein JW953_02225 [Anaerolineae bacterium]|nr:hypothetical protein [Anaerolineae bacterium]